MSEGRPGVQTPRRTPFFALCPICQAAVPLVADESYDTIQPAKLDALIQERAARHSPTCAAQHIPKVSA